MPSALPPPEMQAYDGGDSEEPAARPPAHASAEAETCCTESLSLRSNTKMRKKFNSWIFLDST